MGAAAQPRDALHPPAPLGWGQPRAAPAGPGREIPPTAARPPPAAARTAGRAGHGTAGQGRAGQGVRGSGRRDVARLGSAQKSAARLGSARRGAALVAVLGAEGGTARHGSGGRGGAGAVGRGPAEVSSLPPSRARPHRTDVTGAVFLHFLSRPLVRRPGGLPVHSRAPGWFRPTDAAGSAAPQQVRSPRAALPPRAFPRPHRDGRGARPGPQRRCRTRPAAPGAASVRRFHLEGARRYCTSRGAARAEERGGLSGALDAEPGASRSCARPGRELSLIISGVSLCTALPRAALLTWNVELGGEIIPSVLPYIQPAPPASS